VTAADFPENYSDQLRRLRGGSRKNQGVNPSRTQEAPILREVGHREQTKRPVPPGSRGMAYRQAASPQPGATMILFGPLRGRFANQSFSFDILLRIDHPISLFCRTIAFGPRAIGLPGLPSRRSGSNLLFTIQILRQSSRMGRFGAGRGCMPGFG
jgi:hypothetical protein